MKTSMLVILLFSASSIYAQWIPLDTLENQYNSIYFFDDTLGFLCGQHGIIKKTVDGGTSWSFKYAGADEAINSVYFISENIGFACSYYGRILKTTDGGNSWVQKAAPGGYLYNLKFVSDSVGLAVFSYPFCCIRLYKTTDMGETWTKISEHPTTDEYSYLGFTIAYAFDAVDENSMIVGCDQDLIMVTHDLSAGWAFAYPNDGGDINDLSMASADTIFAACGGGILRSMTGGWSWGWEKVLNEPMRCIQMVNDKNGYAGGVGGIFSTTDGGDTWQQADSVHFGIRSISITQHNGYAISWDSLLTSGSVLKLGNITSVGSGPISNDEISCYPNPFNEKIVIKRGTPAQTGMNIQLLDAAGKLLITSGDIYAGSLNLDTNQLSPGIYFLSIIGKNSNQVLKLVKLKD